MEIKRHWLGQEWYLPGAAGNEINKVCRTVMTAMHYVVWRPADESRSCAPVWQAHIVLLCAVLSVLGSRIVGVDGLGPSQRKFSFRPPNIPLLCVFWAAREILMRPSICYSYGGSAGVSCDVLTMYWSIDERAGRQASVQASDARGRAEDDSRRLTSMRHWLCCCIALTCAVCHVQHSRLFRLARVRSSLFMRRRCLLGVLDGTPEVPMQKSLSPRSPQLQ
jgi:hypothetical protein